MTEPSDCPKRMTQTGIWVLRNRLAGTPTRVLSRWSLRIDSLMPASACPRKRTPCGTMNSASPSSAVMQSPVSTKAKSAAFFGATPQRQRRLSKGSQRREYGGLLTTRSYFSYLASVPAEMSEKPLPSGIRRHDAVTSRVRTSCWKTSALTPLMARLKRRNGIALAVTSSQ